MQHTGKGHFRCSPACQVQTEPTQKSSHKLPHPNHRCPDAAHPLCNSRSGYARFPRSVCGERVKLETGQPLIPFKAASSGEYPSIMPYLTIYANTPQTFVDTLRDIIVNPANSFQMSAQNPKHSSRRHGIIALPILTYCPHSRFNSC
jgi:hypothetical protein